MHTELANWMRIMLDNCYSQRKLVSEGRSFIDKTSLLDSSNFYWLLHIPFRTPNQLVDKF